MSLTTKYSGVLNSKILERKPNLKLCSCHYKSGPRIYRIWNDGTAVRDGKGWYKKMEQPKNRKRG